MKPIRLMTPAGTSLHGCPIDKFVRQNVTRSILDFATGAPATAAPSQFRIEAAKAILTEHQGYTDSAGLIELRNALASKLAQIGFEVDMEREIAITVGATGGLHAAFQSVVGHNDEVLVPVPAYPVFDLIRLAGAMPVPIMLEGPSWELSLESLRRAVTHRTRAIYLNQPGNPTGRVFTPAEIDAVVTICHEHDLTVVEDVVYDEIYFSKPAYVMGAAPGMRDRVIRVGSFSKTHAVPGWRLGFVAATGVLGQRVQRVVETTTGGAVAQLQSAIVPAAFNSAVDFVALRSKYQGCRNLLALVLEGAGFRAPLPEGGIFIYAECPPGLSVAELCARGIAAMPGSVFYPNEDHVTYARFCFARPVEQIHALECLLSHSCSTKASSSFDGFLPIPPIPAKNLEKEF